MSVERQRERHGRFRPPRRDASPDIHQGPADAGGVSVAAELIFGVSSGKGGLGWFIFENRNLLDIPAVFAGLLTVIVIGLVEENLDFPYHRAQHDPQMGPAQLKPRKWGIPDYET